MPPAGYFYALFPTVYRKLLAALSPEKTAVPAQSPEERVKNFDEVVLGYTPKIAEAEAARCLATSMGRKYHPLTFPRLNSKI